jgi:hypothetical protein
MKCVIASGSTILMRNNINSWKGKGHKEKRNHAYFRTDGRYG